MNERFFESICQHVGMIKNSDGSFEDTFSNLTFCVTSDGVYIKGEISNELLRLIMNNVYNQVSDNFKMFNCKRLDNDMIEIKLDAPTIISSVNLINIINVIHNYYQNLHVEVLNCHSSFKPKVKSL